MIFPTEESKEKHLEELEELYDEFSTLSGRLLTAYSKLSDRMSWQDEDLRYFPKISAPVEYIMAQLNKRRAELIDEKAKDITPQ